MTYCTTTTARPIVCPSCHAVTNRKDISHLNIAQTILNYFQIDREKVFSKSRKRAQKDCRFFIIYFVRKYTELTLEETGKLLPGESGNGLDHTSVLHAVKNITDWIKHDEYVRRHYYNLVNIFEG